MPDTKITALAAIVTVDPAVDVLPIVDVSDTSMAASGTTKKITSNQLLGAGGTATLASATITGALTVDTTTLKVDATNHRVGIVQASPAYPLDVTGIIHSTQDVYALGGRFALYRSAGPSYIDWSTSQDLVWRQVTSVGGAGASTLMTLNSTGLGVGVSPTVGFELQQTSPMARITSTSTTGYSTLTLRNTGASGRTYGITVGGSGTGATAAGNLYISDDTASAIRLTLDSSGNVGIGGVTPSAWGTLKGIQVLNAGFIGQSNSAFVCANDFYDGTNWKYIASDFATHYRQQSGNHSWFNENGTRTAGATFTPVQAMTLDASGRLLVGPTSANASGGILQLSSGITFPATQVASSDANTLDDYEEGTWTGTLKGSVSDPTVPVTTTGRYTKIGRLVHVSFNFANVSTVGASGNISITGLPFVSANDGVGAIGSVGFYLAGTFTGFSAANILPNSSVIDFFWSQSNGVNGNVTHNAGVGRYINATIVYYV